MNRTPLLWPLASGCTTKMGCRRLVRALKKNDDRTRGHKWLVGDLYDRKKKRGLYKRSQRPQKRVGRIIRAEDSSAVVAKNLITTPLPDDERLETVTK